MHGNWIFQIRPEPDLPDFSKNSGRIYRICKISQTKVDSTSPNTNEQFATTSLSTNEQVATTSLSTNEQVATTSLSTNGQVATTSPNTNN